MIIIDMSEHVYISLYHVKIQCLMLENVMTRGLEIVNIFVACEINPYILHEFIFNWIICMYMSRVIFNSNAYIKNQSAFHHL